MAEIKAFRGFRYNQELAGEIDNLTSPLFDVVSQEQLKELYSNPVNSIHLSVPEGENPIHDAKTTFRSWKSSEILQQDNTPSIYVYYQYFKLPGMSRELCRKGFIALTKIYDWDNDKVLLRHENTMPWSVNDRQELLEGTQLQPSPTFGLYEDPEYLLEGIMDDAIKEPIYVSEDYQGVKDVLAIISDQELVSHFVRTLRDKQIILADGHHRYEGALFNQRKQAESNPHHDGSEPYNYHMMFFSNSSAGDFRILPTHRIIKGVSDLQIGTLLDKAANDFEIKRISNPSDANEIISGKKHTFALLVDNQAYKLSLKSNPEGNPWPFPELIKQLDVTILHHFFLEKVLGIPGKSQRNSPLIEFDRNFADCLYKVSQKQVQMALVVNEVTMDDIMKVCKSGFTMPQKSTYFYPKAICGFVYYSLEDD